MKINYYILLSLLVPVTSFADTLTYAGPGGAPAPCDTTLQACIDGATSGDTIEIATNDRIDEDLTIDKSLVLDAATGFTPLIGSDDPLFPQDISIDDAGAGGGSVSVIFENLKLDAAQVDVTFNEATDHNFEMTNCVITHQIDNNNETGLEVRVNVPSTILVQRNMLSTPGQPIQFSSNMTSGESSVTFLANRITTTDPSNSHEGIQLRPRGAGDVTLNVFDNVIFGIGGCDCGGPAGIAIDASDTVTATINVTNNTIDDMQVEADGVFISTPDATASVVVNMFNNIITRTTDNGVDFPAFTAALMINHDFNNFFDNLVPNEFGGYGPGENNSSFDPLYVDAANADYHLQENSSLINAGTNTPFGGLPDVDADGNARIIEGTVDLGAFEFNPAAPPPPPPPGEDTGGGCSLIR